MEQKGLGRFLSLTLFLIGLAACANTARFQEQAGAHLSIASAYLGSGQYNAALKELLAAEKLTPEDPKVHYLLGVSYHGKNLDDLAISEFRRALLLKPDDPETHNYLGAIYLEKGRWDDAIASFNRALANILYDTPATTLFNLGRAHHEKGQYDLALKYYLDAEVQEPYTALMPWIEMNMGITWFAKGDPEGAIRHLRKSLDLFPSLVESQYWLGLCYRRMNRHSEAVAAFQAAVNLAPESEFARKSKENLKTVIP